jgi:hypothetical protein
MRDRRRRRPRESTTIDGTGFAEFSSHIAARSQAGATFVEGAERLPLDNLSRSELEEHARRLGGVDRMAIMVVIRKSF